MQGFAETAAAIAATPSKLAKVSTLAAHLRSLDEENLAVATRYFAGRLLPTSDPRVVGVGGAALVRVILELSGADEERMRAAYRRHADIGDVADELLAEAGHQGSGLALLDVARGIDAMASARSSAARTAALRGLLASCSPDQARYVVKLITGDMRIGLREGLVEEAVAKAFDRPVGAVHRADMLLGDLGECARLAASDRLGEAAPRLFSPLRFMLASPAAGSAEVVERMGEEVWVEDKYDGIRCQLHSGQGRVALYSRDLRDVTGQFPEVVAAAAALDTAVILDGELLAMRGSRVLPFQDLQNRLGRKQPAAALLERVPVVMVAWDLLWQDGEPLLDTRLRERRRRLEALALGPGFALAHQEHANGAGALEQLFLDARARSNEGLMAKDPDSLYTPGRRGLAWLKLKRPLDTLDVVVVGAEWGNGKRRGVLSDVTFAVRDDASGDLVTIGKAYTGLSDEEIAAMTEELLALTVADHGHHRIVEPRLVIEVAFDRVQASARHRSGYALRFPRIVRRRDDKAVDDIDTVATVRRIADALAGGGEKRVDVPDAAAS